MVPSRYERVFVHLASRTPLRIGEDVFLPATMKGWYNAVLRRESDGAERIMSIDQIAEGATWLE
jgi:hypothetical protein